ncbi:MAG: trigger factor [Burkholderiaceae bacterium]|nr:trigger factor [Burkholderiaceae bacterium]
MTDTTETVETKVEETKAEEVKNPLLRTVEFSIPRKDVQAAIAKELRNYAKKAKFHGFRPGKAPFAMVQAAYGAEAEYKVINHMAIDAYVKKVEEEKLHVVGNPDIRPVEGGADAEELKFVAEFETYPEVNVPDLTEANVTEYECEVTEEDFNKTLDIMRKQRATYEKVERVAEDTDRITLDFKGTLNGEAFQGGTAENYNFVLGAGQMLPDFEAAVRGMAAGEEKVFPLTFPENYAPELAGKEVQFEIKVKEVAKEVLPELNDDFATALGVTEGGIEKMKADVRDNLEREVKTRVTARTKQSVMDAILAVATFTAPTAMVEDERKNLVDNLLLDFKRRGMDVKNFPVPPEAMKDQAEKRVRLGIQINTIVEKEKLEAAEDKVRALAQDIAKSFEDPAEVVDWYMNNAERRSELTAVALENEVVAWVLSKAKVTKEKISFDQLMGRKA